MIRIFKVRAISQMFQLQFLIKMVARAFDFIHDILRRKREPMHMRLSGTDRLTQFRKFQKKIRFCP